MPIENEKKFILSLDSEKDVKNQSLFTLKIQQGYLSTNARLRMTTKMGGKVIYEFTFKYPTKDGLVEIEKEISEKDFNRLKDYVTAVVIKTRYILLTLGDKWEIDFLENENGEVYFALAEHEMPEGQEYPDSIPDIIQQYCIKIVNKNDKSFVNKRLAKESYAKKKLNVIFRKMKEKTKITPKKYIKKLPEN